MTDKKQQPTEFIITKAELDDIGRSYALDTSHKLPARKRCEIIERIRSRSHPSPAPESEPTTVWAADPKKGCSACKNTECNHCDMRNENIRKHDARIAAEATAAERERVLNEISECFLSDSIIYEGSFIHKTIESLRSQP